MLGGWGAGCRASRVGEEPLSTNVREVQHDGFQADRKVVDRVKYRILQRELRLAMREIIGSGLSGTSLPENKFLRWDFDNYGCTITIDYTPDGIPIEPAYREEE